MAKKTDVLIIGAGLAGLVAANEAVQRGRHVVIVDQEGAPEFGRAGILVAWWFDDGGYA